MKKICPIQSRRVPVSFDTNNVSYITTEYEPVHCAEGECAFWVEVFTTENISVRNCAHVLNAMKNADGKIPV